MSRYYADPVEVSRRDDLPAQFLWRGRLYLVREVLSSWVESGCWWRTPAAAALSSGLEGAAEPAPAPELVLAPLPPSPKWAQRAWGEPAPDVGASTGPAGVDDGERQFWRVEAAAGRAAPLGTYDLCLDPLRGDWTVARTHD
jgi:hypothetical protein